MKVIIQEITLLLLIILTSTINTSVGRESLYQESLKLNIEFLERLVNSPKDFDITISNSFDQYKVIVDTSRFYLKINILHDMKVDFLCLNFEYAGSCIFKKHNKTAADSVLVHKVLYEEKYEFDEEIKDWWYFWYAGCDLSFCCNNNFIVFTFIWEDNFWHLNYYVLNKCRDSYLVLDIGNTNVP